MFMGKRVFEDVDEKTFQYIKRCKNDNGFVDCHKLFKKLYFWHIQALPNAVSLNCNVVVYFSKKFLHKLF